MVRNEGFNSTSFWRFPRLRQRGAEKRYYAEFWPTADSTKYVDWSLH
jgi:hypothetical protein